MAQPRLPRVRARTSIALLALCVAMFALLAADLRLHGPVTRADVPISVWFHVHAQPSFIAAAAAVSKIHSTLAICLYALAAGLALALFRHVEWLPLLAFTVPGGLILNALVKHVFARARPSFGSSTMTLASYSFPSGHTADATVWWGFALLFWFAWQKRRGPRAAACVLAITMILVTGLSRMVLGLHYFSDVLAAMAEGAGWIVLCLAACQRLTSPPRLEHTP
jgi:membrane-associated phospholipid phosphatase